jgi:hypothetical protein
MPTKGGAHWSGRMLNVERGVDRSEETRVKRDQEEHAVWSMNG